MLLEIMENKDMGCLVNSKLTNVPVLYVLASYFVYFTVHSYFNVRAFVEGLRWGWPAGWL